MKNGKCSNPKQKLGSKQTSHIETAKRIHTKYNPNLRKKETKNTTQSAQQKAKKAKKAPTRNSWESAQGFELVISCLLGRRLNQLGHEASLQRCHMCVMNHSRRCCSFLKR